MNQPDMPEFRHSLVQHLYYLGSGHHIVLERKLPILPHIPWQKGMVVDVAEEWHEVVSLRVELATGALEVILDAGVYDGEFSDSERKTCEDDGWRVTEWPKMSERVIAAKRAEMMKA